MIVNYGYPNVIIQKLPFTNAELQVISKEIVNSSFSDISFQLLRDRNFSDEEIAILDEYRKE